MTRTPARLIVWLPRVLGIVVAVFLGVFALDAFGEGIGSVAAHAIPDALSRGRARRIGK